MSSGSHPRPAIDASQVGADDRHAEPIRERRYHRLAALELAQAIERAPAARDPDLMDALRGALPATIRQLSGPDVRAEGGVANSSATLSAQLLAMRAALAPIVERRRRVVPARDGAEPDRR